MEISKVSEDCIKIKGKHASLVIDPTRTLRTKTPADFVLSFNAKNLLDTAKVENFRLVISGSGEYEIGGIKISGSRIEDDLAYQIFVDNVDIMLVNATSIEKAKDKLSSHQILLINANEKIDIAKLITLEPRVLILYGEMSEDIEGEGISKTSKFAVTKDKLPDTAETVILSV